MTKWPVQKHNEHHKTRRIYICFPDKLCLRKRLLNIDDVIMPAFFMTRVVFVHQNKSRMEENIMSDPNLIIYKQLLR